MNDALLERVHLKVEQGETLSDDEWRLLRAAAQASDGPTPRLYLAHALSNAHEERQAIELFGVICRDFPKEVQAHLGLARALMALERHSEAERALKHAVALSPKDPEALKVLAILSMRRGELSRANALVDEVLSIDPLDPEAQLLRSELSSAEPSPPGGPQLPSGPRELLAGVFPVLRGEEFLPKAKGLLRKSGPAGLWIFYSFDELELLYYLSRSALGQRRLRFDALDQAAWTNLEQRPARPKPVLLEEGRLVFTQAPTGLWALAEADGHDSARLLTAAQRSLLGAVSPAPWSVFLGHRELVLFCSQADGAACGKLASLLPSAEGLGGAFLLEAGGALHLEDKRS